MTSINRPCCVIPKIEFAKLNYTTDVIKRKTLEFWLLTLQNVDRNSWEKICSGITNLNSTGEFIIPAETIALSEKNRDKKATTYHEDVSEADDSDHSINSNESA